MGEKASKYTFLKPEKLQNHSNKGKKKRKEPGERKEEKRTEQFALLVFIIATFGGFWPKKAVRRKRSIY